MVGGISGESGPLLLVERMKLLPLDSSRRDTIQAQTAAVRKR